MYFLFWERNGISGEFRPSFEYQIERASAVRSQHMELMGNVVERDGRNALGATENTRTIIEGSLYFKV